MRKVIGIGETILDILFKNNQPQTAIPGGSVFNGIISLSRMGVEVEFISETGNDRVGDIILHFIEENGIKPTYINRFPDGKSPVSLAFLDENNDASYSFYKDYPNQRLDTSSPKIEPNDILVFGSYFALNPVLRGKVTELLDAARDNKSMIYYDVNFRSNHKHEAMRLNSSIIENLEYAHIVRGSKEDFANMYGGLTDVDKIYNDKIKFYCPNFICTDGNRSISLRTRNLSKEYRVEPIKAVSTIAAGDNFNAGIVYGLLQNRIRLDDLDTLEEQDWDAIIQTGQAFATDVCMSYGNSVSEEFVKRIGRR